MWGQDASLLVAVGIWEAIRQRSIMLHLSFLTFMQLAEDGEKLWGTAKAQQNFLQSIRPTVAKALVRSTKAAYRPMFCYLHFPCICLSTKIMVPVLDLNRH